MGNVTSWLLRDGDWSSGPPPADGPGPAWLHLDIHDSDLTTIRYQPHYAGSGIAFVGTTPRIYFEDESASAPTDTEREAAGLAAWVSDSIGGDPMAHRDTIRPFLAEDLEDDWDGESEVSDADIFVEVKTGELLAALGIDPPPGLLD